MAKNILVMDGKSFSSARPQSLDWSTPTGSISELDHAIDSDILSILADCHGFEAETNQRDSSGTSSCLSTQSSDVLMQDASFPDKWTGIEQYGLLKEDAVRDASPDVHGWNRMTDLVSMEGDWQGAMYISDHLEKMSVQTPMHHHDGLSAPVRREVVLSDLLEPGLYPMVPLDSFATRGDPSPDKAELRMDVDMDKLNMDPQWAVDEVLPPFPKTEQQSMWLKNVPTSGCFPMDSTMSSDGLPPVMLTTDAHPQVVSPRLKRFCVVHGDSQSTFTCSATACLSSARTRPCWETFSCSTETWSP